MASFSIQGNFPPAGHFDSLGQLFSDIIAIMVTVVGIAAIFFIIMGGIKMLTAGGDPKKLETARSTVYYAIIGLIVTALAFVILQVVQYFLRSNIPISS